MVLVLVVLLRINQMASLLQTDAQQGLMNLQSRKIYVPSLPSRCGVFAKTDIQRLLNEGAPKEDIAVSIFQAVVSGLACETN